MLRRTPLRRVSKKRLSQQPDYERAIQRVFLRDLTCRARYTWPEVECSGRLDPHHVWTQRMWPERRCDPDAMVLACRAHHDAIHSHTDLARQRGLLK